MAMNGKLFVYLALTRNGLNGGRVFTSATPPRDLVGSYETKHPGWYLKHVWSVDSEEDAARRTAAIRAEHPNRAFD